MTAVQCHWLNDCGERAVRYVACCAVLGLHFSRSRDQAEIRGDVSADIQHVVFLCNNPPYRCMLRYVCGHRSEAGVFMVAAPARRKLKKYHSSRGKNRDLQLKISLN